VGFKEICCDVGTALDNEFIQVRADRTELGQDLTERINGVANQVKVLDGKVTKLEARFDRLETKVTGLQDGQTEMMSILIAIQRKLDIDRPDVDSASAN